MKAEDISRFYFHDVKKPPVMVDRRKFLKNLGGGIIVVFSLSQLSLISGCKPKKEDKYPEFNAYLRVKEDGRIDCFSGKIEMGQGVITSIPQVLAEELEVEITQIDMIMGDTELSPYDDGTWGSMTTRFHDPVIRAAAAEARLVLIELAAEKLKVSTSDLVVQKGMIYVSADREKKISYSDLTKGKKIIRSIEGKPALKKPGEYKLTGKPVHRLDSDLKVTGKAVYTADIRLPGLLYAKILRPPAHGSKLISHDTVAAEAIGGIKILKDGDFIVVLHASPEQAEEALSKIKSEWEVPPAKANNETIFEYIVKTATESNVVAQGGDLETGKKDADFVFEHEYHDGYKAHASIETHAATAVFEKGKLTMWASSQTPFGTREEVANLLGIPKENVHLKQIFIGGGFGGKIYNQQAGEAARIAKMMEGTPVQLMWNRQEEFMYDMFRPAGVIKIKSGVKKDGKICYWDYGTYCAGDRGTELFYGIPNFKTTSFDKADLHPFGTGAWRAPGNYTNTFGRESQIDIMASKIGMDPLEFRLKNISDQRAMNSLKLAAEKFGWTQSKPAEGNGRGIAVGTDAGTLVTVIVEVSVDTNTGNIKVQRAVIGQDMGQVINPQGTIIQAEGCVNMGLGYTLSEDVEFEWGKVISNNFGNYNLPLFSMIPEIIDTNMVEAMDQPPQGGGEPAIICIGAAVANAVFEACGARLFRMPFTPARVLEALKKA